MEPFSYELPYSSRRGLAFGTSAVASSHALASQAALRVLDRGGNAVDAALAAASTLTVVEPTMNGLGGDLFALVWDGQALHGLNASGRSPRGWSLERFAGRARMPELGWDAVTVPGAVSGWQALHHRFGSKPWADLLSAAVEYAEDGFLVTPHVAALWAEAPRRFAGFAEFAKCFLPGGAAPKVGSRVRLEDLGKSLREIAETAGESFYRGALAARIADCSHAEGGALDAVDLAQQRAIWVEPLSVDYAGITLHELPPNGQGLATLLALAVLRELELERFLHDAPDAIHLQVEAMKVALTACARYVADPESMNVTVEELLDSRNVRALAASIDLRRARDPASSPQADHGTVYVATADRAGCMVSLIQSNYLGFGSGVVVPGTGISLQNRGLGFRLEPGHPSCVGGGKRPYHTIMPGFVTRGSDAEMAFGVIGGHMQPQGHLQLVLRSFLYGQNPQAACDAPRWHVTEAQQLALEPAFADATRAELLRRGHRLVEAPTLLFGGAQIVRRIEAGYCAASDPRKDGQAVAS